MNTMNVNGQNGAATSAVKNVNDFSNDLVRIENCDWRNRGGSFKWQIDVVKMIVDHFTFVDTDTDSLKVDVIVWSDQIIVKAWFNGKEYRLEKIITAETGKKKIKRILDDMGVVEDVIKRGTEQMMKQMMEQEDNTIDLTEEDVINEVVEVINANLIDDATEGQKLDWTLFSDSTMEYLFANGGPELYEKIKNGVKSRRIAEVLAYDDCFYVWYDEEPAKNDAPCLDEDDVYAVVEQLCTDMQEKMIECGDFMIGYKYAEPDFQGRSAEWFEDMIFVTKKSDLDENGDYVWDDCEVFRIGDYFTFVVELLRGDFDVIADIKDAIVEYMGNNNVA